MTDRPFPPSPRRHALTRRAGLTAASPVLVGALAAATAAIAIAAARGLAGRLAAAVTAACAAGDALAMTDVPTAVLAVITPVLGATAAVAVAAHLAQTRAVWIPRRRIDGAPALDAGPGARTRRAALDLAGAAVIGATAFGWLWLMAPRLAALVELSPTTAPGAAAALLGSAVAAIAVAWLGLGVIDALARHAELARSLAMTAAEQREDERLAAADPRWARQRAALARPSLAGAAVLVLGDDVAAAIAWDAARRPIPTRVAVGRRATARQLLGLARRDGVPVHRDAALAAALGDAAGPVPAAHWPTLASVIAALRR